MKHYDKHYCADESAHDAGHCYLNAVRCRKWPHRGDDYCVVCGINLSVDAPRDAETGEVSDYRAPTSTDGAEWLAKQSERFGIKN